MSPSSYQRTIRQSVRKSKHSNIPAGSEREKDPEVSSAAEPQTRISSSTGYASTGTKASRRTSSRKTIFLDETTASCPSGIRHSHHFDDPGTAELGRPPAHRNRRNLKTQPCRSFLDGQQQGNRSNTRGIKVAPRDL